MELPHESVLLRIFIGESDRHGHLPLYEAIVLKARELHLAGATVLRGAMGFGKSSRMHTSKILRLSVDLPLLIEIVDSEEKINAFLPVLDGMISGGLVTLEKVRAIRYLGTPPPQCARPTGAGPARSYFATGCAPAARLANIESR